MTISINFLLVPCNLYLVAIMMKGCLLMKRFLYLKEKRTALIIVASVLISLITAAAVYCIHKFLLDKHEESDNGELDEDEEEFIDENGVCYTDEKNFVN